jgi:gamma-glutamylaminecyclotransferase
MNRDPDTLLLFVYGTLMRGGRNHGALAAQRFLREAQTRPKYRLLDLGAYPGLVPAETDGRAIRGELYEVERRQIAELDRIEGAPAMYRLERVEIEDEADPVSAYIYRRESEGLPVVAGDRWVNLGERGNG